jgi:GR25 family glycosyltransferase involved in LPS biosynthesis
MNAYRFISTLFLILTSCLSAEIQDHFKPCPGKSNYHNMKNIDFIYVINLDRRPDRYEDICNRLNPYGIYPYRFSAVNGWELPIETINDVGLKYEPWMKNDLMGTYYYLDENGQIQHAHEIIHDPEKTYFAHCVARGPIAITLSHLSVLQDAYDSGYETIWVIEDDVEVIRNPNCLPSLIEKLDALVGNDGWDVLFTDQDIRKQNGEYNSCYWHANRPNFTPWNSSLFAKRETVSPEFKKIGARWGSHSMIIRRSGIEKILNFIKVYRIFFPYDMDYILPSDIDSDIQLYTVIDDVISNQVDSISDNGGPSYSTN